MLLGLGAGDRVVVPEVAYPTYVVGALVAGCEVVASDDPAATRGAKLVWINTPGNPTGAVISAILPASILEMSRMSLRIESRYSPLSISTASRSACAGLV